MRIDGLTPFEPAVATAAKSPATIEPDPKLHAAALQFEELLVRQLTHVLAETAKGDEEEGGDSATSFYADQLPDVLASAIKDAGGLGLAAQLEGVIGAETA